MAIQNKCHMRHTIYAKCLQKYRLSSSPTHTTLEISFSCSIPNTMPQGPHQYLWYLQSKYQHLHDRGGNHVRIGENMSSPT
jgi:hypothetical protein